MRRPFSNENGSIFMVGLITAFIGAIVSFAILAYALDYKRYAERTVLQGDFQSLNAQVYSMIEQENSCRRALNTNVFSPPLVVGDTQDVNILYPGTGTQLVGATALPFGRLNNLSARIRVTNVTGAGAYFGVLELSSNMDLERDKTLGTNDLRISFHLGVGNVIDSCTGVTFVGSTGNVHGVRHCTGDGQALFSDGVDLFCSKVLCWGAFPTHTGAWNADGSAVCVFP